MSRRMGSLLVSLVSLVPALVLAPRTSYPWAASATNGRARSGSESCWQPFDNNMSMLNTCGSGTANTQKFYVMPPIWTWSGAYNAQMRVQGTYLQTSQWVSCVAMMNSGTAYNIGPRGTTQGASSTVQTLNLGTINAFSDTQLVFDCDATYGGKVINAYYW